LTQPSDCATASAEIGRGLHQLLESNGGIRDIVIAIHEAMSREPPKSKIPEALTALAERIEARIDGLTTEVRALRVAVEGR
jgi:hypothetical protein